MVAHTIHPFHTQVDGLGVSLSNVDAQISNCNFTGLSTYKLQPILLSGFIARRRRADLQEKTEIGSMNLASSYSVIEDCAFTNNDGRQAAITVGKGEVVVSQCSFVNNRLNNTSPLGTTSSDVSRTTAASFADTDEQELGHSLLAMSTL